MPELPEVHTTATILNRLLSGAAISDAWTDYGGVIHRGKKNIKDTVFFAGFKKEIIGKKITGVTRRGKNVLIHLGGGVTIIIHMKMTGHLLVGQYTFQSGAWHSKETGPLSEPINQFIRLAFTLTDGRTLVLSDLRKFAKVTMTETAALSSHPDICLLGPDPTQKNFTFKEFKTRLLKKQNGKIKAVLLDQTILSGIGNIYSDEVLWAASIHPNSITNKISVKNLKLLSRAIQTILKQGVTLGGDSTSDYRNPHGLPGKFHYHHRAYRRTKEHCTKRNCPGTIQRLAFSGRGAHFCDTHQHLFS